jgi:DNA-binding beta-propeller fold protein YncE
LKLKLYQRFFWLGICLIFFPLAEVGSSEVVRHIPVELVTDIRRDFNQPTEVAVGKKGRIYILDGANNQVKVFNQKWEFVLALGQAGEGNGEFRNPVGLDIDERGYIHVADTGNQRIQVFDDTGKYLQMIDLSRWKARPVEVKATQGATRIYVSDARNHRILCFNSDGTFNFSWGDLGEQLGELRFPGMMAADKKGNIYVVDILNGRIQLFNFLGKDPRQIGELGVLAGQLYRPKGIAIDDRSQIYVSDSYTGIIQVFDRAGKLRGILSEKNDAFLRLTTPVGLAFDAKGRFYVVQSALNKVSVYQFRDN